MKLKWKFTLLFTLILSTIFISTALFSSYRVFKSNRELTDGLSTQLIESKANEAGGWLSQRIQELHTISRTPTVVSMDEEALKSYVTQLSNDMDEDYGNEYGTFGINNFSGFEYITENQTIDVRERDYFKEMLVTNEEYIFSEPVNSKTDQSLITVLCYSIYNENRSKVGFVAASISLSKLTSITDNLSFYEGKSVIMDRAGTLYTYGEKLFSEDMLRSVKESLPKDDKEQVATELIGEIHTAFYAPIPGSNDWFLCTVVDNNKLYEDTQILTSSLILFWILMLIMGILSAFFVSQRITKRITTLSNAMDEVQKGNFHERLTMKGKDEISQMTGHFNDMVENIRVLMDEVVITQKEKRQRELQVLQAQINPHFLYNTLDTIQWKALEYEAHDLSDLILSLASFFRISLSKGEEKITLEREIEHVRNYLEVQQYRYSELLDYEIYVDESIKDVMIPKIIIQPLVENAIYHGIKPKLEKGKIIITVEKIEGDVRIQVKDDGVGIEEEKRKTLMENISDEKFKGSYGLYNVHQRILLYYGAEYGITMESTYLKGAIVSISLPIEKGE